MSETILDPKASEDESVKDTRDEGLERVIAKWSRVDVHVYAIYMMYKKGDLELGQAAAAIIQALVLGKREALRRIERFEQERVAL